MGQPISDLTAAQLSSAAYVPLAAYAAGKGPILPDGWVANVELSWATKDGANQFITFMNSDTQQSMMTVKGSNYPQNFYSDLTDSGYSIWQKLNPEMTRVLGVIQQDYPEYDISANGHSVGGGVAQTFAWLNNLSGYGQNSLPISPGALQDAFQGSLVNFDFASP
jgi:hypothetical protein